MCKVSFVYCSSFIKYWPSTPLRGTDVNCWFAYWPYLIVYCRVTPWVISSATWSASRGLTTCLRIRTSCTAGRPPRASRSARSTSTMYPSCLSTWVGSGRSARNGRSASTPSPLYCSSCHRPSSIKCCRKTGETSRLNRYYRVKVHFFNFCCYAFCLWHMIVFLSHLLSLSGSLNYD